MLKRYRQTLHDAFDASLRVDRHTRGHLATQIQHNRELSECLMKACTRGHFQAITEEFRTYYTDNDDQGELQDLANGLLEQFLQTTGKPMERMIAEEVVGTRQNTEQLLEMLHKLQKQLDEQSRQPSYQVTGTENPPKPLKGTLTMNLETQKRYQAYEENGGYGVFVLDLTQEGNSYQLDPHPDMPEGKTPSHINITRNPTEVQQMYLYQVDSVPVPLLVKVTIHFEHSRLTHHLTCPSGHSLTLEFTLHEHHTQGNMRVTFNSMATPTPDDLQMLKLLAQLSHGTTLKILDVTSEETLLEIPHQKALPDTLTRVAQKAQYALDYLLASQALRKAGVITEMLPFPTESHDGFVQEHLLFKRILDWRDGRLKRVPMKGDIETSMKTAQQLAGTGKLKHHIELSHTLMIGETPILRERNTLPKGTQVKIMPLEEGKARLEFSSKKGTAHFEPLPKEEPVETVE